MQWLRGVKAQRGETWCEVLQQEGRGDRPPRKPHRVRHECVTKCVMSRSKAAHTAAERSHRRQPSRPAIIRAWVDSSGIAVNQELAAHPLGVHLSASEDRPTAHPHGT